MSNCIFCEWKLLIPYICSCVVKVNKWYFNSLSAINKKRVLSNRFFFIITRNALNNPAVGDGLTPIARKYPIARKKPLHQNYHWFESFFRAPCNLFDWYLEHEYILIHSVIFVHFGSKLSSRKPIILICRSILYLAKLYITDYL